MRARLVLDGTADELRASCAQGPNVLDLTVVEVVHDGKPRQVVGLAPLSRNVSDPAGGPGPAVRVQLAPKETHDDR